MKEHKHPKRSGKYEWQTQKAYDRLVDILSNIDTPSKVKMVPTWMVPKLADALIENGVTLSTFKVGDIVWVYDFMWGIIPCEVDQSYHCRSGKEGGCTFEMSFTEEDIDKYIFATKEDAEKYWHTNEVIL